MADSFWQVLISMWIEKLADGVLQIDTPIGPRYIQPSLSERAYLMWTFRNFPCLPQQVLSPTAQRLVDRLWSDHRFVSVSATDGPSQPVIGCIERRPAPQPDAAAARKPLRGTPTSVREQGREAASA